MTQCIFYILYFKLWVIGPDLLLKIPGENSIVEEHLGLCVRITHTHTYTHTLSETLNYTHIINNWLKDWYSWNIFLISRRLLIDIRSSFTGIETYNKANIQKIKIVVTQSLTAVGFLSCMYACRVMQANSLIKWYWCVWRRVGWNSEG